MRKLASTLAGALVIAVVGCSEQLVVANVQAPDTERALARATDVENLIGSSYRTINNATDGNTLSMESQLLVMGMESYSGNANAGMSVRGAIPRGAIDNNRGNQTLNENYGPWVSLHRAARAAATGLSRFLDTTFTFNPVSAARRQRARAFAFFVKGVALGNIAMVYDSGAIVSETDPPSVVRGDSITPLVGYSTLVQYALAQLDSALKIATGTVPSGASWFPIPSTWINSNALTAAQFAQLCYSWKARIRSSVARTPAERALVDWTKVIADAQAGITTDFAITMVNQTGGWFYEPAQMDLFGSWHQMWQFMVGMADTSGGYQAWLATPTANRIPFLVVTPDLRFPQGITRSGTFTGAGGAQQANSPSLSSGPSGNLFLRNRPGSEDTPGSPLGYSMYDFYRFQAFYNNNYNSPPNIPVMTRAEMNGLIAEGAIRTTQFALATQYIDSSRVKRGLPKLSGVVTDAVTPVPGGAGCVPQTPTGAGNAVVCGTIMEAMKWEKRMETAFTRWGAWYFDGRGWGDLPANTPLQYPVPYQELDARLHLLYTYFTGAAAGNYGL